MMSGEKIRRMDDVECEREYGYVCSTSGPSMKMKVCSLIKSSMKFLVIIANQMFGSLMNEIVILKNNLLENLIFQ